MDFREFLVSQKPDVEQAGTTGLPHLLIRLFAPLEFGEGSGFGDRPHFVASIQASSFHHCQLGEELDANQYASFEVMLSEIVKGKEKILNPALDAQFETASWANFWKHERNYGSSATGIYIPVAEVQKMYNDLDALCSGALYPSEGA